ncbi:MAG: MmgE/PrpD family protein [Peptococcaceae bacterium MAG4]|nr:MmgE/PrpD family protein [Peptococcaceae bacterium MAG4]NLW37044.1 MmgE/PrpD family protein [Peptococcaceae bacterium]
MISYTEDLIANIIATNFDSLDKETVERAKWRILDSVGVIIAGANGVGNDALLKLVKKWGGPEESTILVHGGKALAQNVAMMNSLMMRSFDFEAIEAEGENKTSSPAHISGSTVPTALAMAEKQAASGKDMIAALVLGDDVACRIAAASGFDVYGGWDNTGTVNAFGATAIAGKMLNLNQRQMRDAFGIVLNQLGGTMENVNDKAMTFKLPIALAARNGIFAAELAQQGFHGPKDALFGNKGYFAQYTKNADTRNLTRDLGKKFFADCVIKPYASCRATHPSIDAVMKIVTSQEISIDDIEKIIIHVTPRTLKGFVGQPFVIGETPQVDAAFSIRYTAACAILRKSVRPEHFTLEAITNPGVNTLLDKMELVDTLPPDEYQTAEVDIIMKDGEKYHARTDVPKGDIFKNPMTQEEIISKYKLNVAYSKTISEQKAEEALRMLLSLEELDDIRKLTGLLC